MMVTLKLYDCGVVRLHFWRLYLGFKTYTPCSFAMIIVMNKMYE